MADGLVEVGLTDSTLSLGKPSTWQLLKKKKVLDARGKRSEKVKRVEARKKKVPEIMKRTYEDKLNLIAEMAKRDKKVRFTTLYHMVNQDSLQKSYKNLNKTSACGTDGVTVREYGEHLEDNISNLNTRLRRITYKPKSVRRVNIPKPGKKGATRPLGLPATEDKIVQMAAKEILEAIYEQDFKDFSHGFRPGKGCHTAIKELNNAVMYKSINFIVEVDIKKFFDTVNHKWLYEMLKQRIADPVFLGLIWKMLRAGVMEGGQVKTNENGTPQGGIISPILANIYLHYALDLWFDAVYRKRAKGYVQLIRYCDDFVMVCEREHDADLFLELLEERLAMFRLEISEEKTKILKFGRRVWQQTQKNNEKVETFDFLGFTHYCGASRNGLFIMGHKTSKQRLREKLRTHNLWLKKMRNVVPMRDLWKLIKSKLIGHYNYFGINGNMRCLRQYFGRIISLCFKWLNRRSQKKSMNWKQFMKYLQWNPLPQPRIYHKILYSMPK